MAIKTWGRVARWIAGIVVVLLVLAGMVILGWAWKSQPIQSGTLKVSGLGAPVTIERDASGIPHINAQSPEDAAFAMGWLHAAERGWQLEFNRRVVAGSLSEVLGEATLSADKTLRSLGIRQAAEAQHNNMPADVKASLQAYANGINSYWAGFDGVLTPEFVALGVDPRVQAKQGAYWHPVDSVGWALVMALDLGGNWAKELERMQLAQRLSTEDIWTIMPPYPGEAPATATDFAQMYKRLGVYAPPSTPAAENRHAPAGDAMAQATARWVEALGQTEGLGSNNWVVDGSRTQTGKPLLANDPHLGLGAPAIWYFAHMRSPDRADAQTPRELDVIGATLPGMPFVVLGHTKGVAWGFTNTGPDVQDVYIEQVNSANPNEYRVPSSDAGQARWAPFETRQERIRVKGQEDVLFTVRSTRHGPVISDNGKYTWLDPRYVLALRWSALDADNMTVVAGFRGNRAQTVEELKVAYADYHSPMQNAVMADTKGQIAYQAIGRAPVRRSDHDLQGVAPAPGWEPRFDWLTWIPRESNPRDDGARGWVATANQRIHAPDYPHFLTQDWVAPYRMERIEERLLSTKSHTIDSFKAIQNDVISLEAKRWLPLLKPVQGTHPLAASAKDLLTQWDGAMSKDAAAPLIFNAWLAKFGEQILRDRLGDDLYKRVSSGRQQFRTGLLEIVEKQRWCGDCAGPLGAALDAALSDLSKRYGDQPAKWRWGEAHTAISSHKPFGQVPVLKSLFDVKRASAGDGFTVNVGQYHLSDPKAPFASRHAASMRAIYDLADLDRSVFIYQTGQSGNVFSAAYRDMADDWAEGRYRPLRMTPVRIEHRLTLEPAR